MNWHALSCFNVRVNRSHPIKWSLFSPINYGWENNDPFKDLDEPNDSVAAKEKTAETGPTEDK